jgi:hypothetical protein
MAKKQTFISKLGKDKKNFKFAKYIKTFLSEKTGHIKFLSRMIRLEENENIDQALKREEEESSNILSFGEQVTEEAQEETPAEETQEEVPVEEVQEETPAEEAPVEEPAEEELKEEQPAEETPAEETQEEAPSEEPTEEAPAEESAPEEDSAEEAEESSKE